MTMFAKPFDARTVEPQQAFEPLPAGWYTALISGAEEKDAAKDDGKYLELAMDVIGGDYNKRKIFDRLNLVHKNDMVVDIAYRTLSAICHATGQLVVNNAQELLGKPMLVKVSLRAARHDVATGKDYEASNEVKGYKAIDPNAPPVTGPTKPQGGPAAAAGPTPAWAASAPAAASSTPATPPPAWAKAAEAPAAPAASPVAAPPVAPPSPAASTFPPEGWTAHPEAAGYFYKGTEVLTEAALRATMAPPVPPAPVAPPVPPAPAQASAPATGGAPPWAAGGTAAATAGTPPWAKPAA